MEDLVEVLLENLWLFEYLLRDPLVSSGLFFLLGLFFLVFGYKSMYRYRLIRDTPRSKIRSMAMGIVEVHGKVKADKSIKSPFSRTNCVYYRYEVKEYRRHTYRDSKGRIRTTYSWDLVASGDKSTPFFALDETGEVYVKSKGAEFNVGLKKVFLQKRGGLGFSIILDGLRLWDSREKVFDVSKLSLVPLETGRWSASFGGCVGDRRYFEYFLEPGEDLFVLGTAVRDPKSSVKVFVRKGRNEPTFIISNRKEKDLVSKLRWRAFWSFFGSVVCFCLSTYIILKVYT